MGLPRLVSIMEDKLDPLLDLKTDYTLDTFTSVVQNYTLDTFTSFFLQEYTPGFDSQCTEVWVSFGTWKHFHWRCLVKKCIAKIAKQRIICGGQDNFLV